MLKAIIHKFKFWLQGKEMEKRVNSKSLLQRLKANNKRLLSELNALEEVKKVMKKYGDKWE